MLDHYAVSPPGLYPNRVVVRVLAYCPARVSWPGMRFRVQHVDATGRPTAESPLMACEGVPFDEVRAFVEASHADGWILFPVTPVKNLRKSF